MATTEQINQQLERANKEYEEVKGQLERLRELSLKDDLTDKEKRELALLKEEQVELKGKETFWMTEIGKVTDALRAAMATTQTGNSFVFVTQVWDIE